MAGDMGYTAGVLALFYKVAIATALLRLLSLWVSGR
ncbi:oxaloacetate decarboxylase subunit beta [Mannheimia haemolytica]|uniref:Oxaloacetate decarboxylase subunit beta n=1 Tax=Mannheimia haemolytica TaxID=75985 RepID=A0A378MVU9_MANHA|nr:oxaloacetate decarboxylase subunit beta [Mannheimia haemolytica]